jgi:3-phosphoshikimate 1-carboxyvinyltransferase
MVAPYAREDVTLRLAGRLASPPYIDLTMNMMAEWGVTVRRAEGTYLIATGQSYRARSYDVPPDASSASYFLAAAAVTGGTVRVRNLSLAAEQGDLGFVDVLARMGCTVRYDGADVELTGPDELSEIDLDLNGMSDMTMTLAAIAPFARGPVTIRNVAHIRVQETDRLAATVSELRRLGARVEERSDGLTVFPSSLHGATVRTYNDHRMAMAFAVVGLRVEEVIIDNPGCVSKTFPDYFTRLEAACDYP